MNKMVLASASPRRIEMLKKFNGHIEVVKSHIKETISQNEAPEMVAMALAFQKAQNVSKNIEPGKIVIGADTVVYKEQILGKPVDRQEALEMLLNLNGQEHDVITGICILKAHTHLKVIDYCKTKVKFKQLSRAKLERYIDTEEYRDKAGGYGIQGFGAVLVDFIQGSYSNVVGLPISKVDQLLDQYFGVQLL